MIIYRVETETGEGPYAEKDLGYRCGAVHSAPTAYEDHPLSIEWKI